jgi:hypothetical protein
VPEPRGDPGPRDGPRLHVPEREEERAQALLDSIGEMGKARSLRKLRFVTGLRDGRLFSERGSVFFFPLPTL